MQRPLDFAAHYQLTANCMFRVPGTHHPIPGDDHKALCERDNLRSSRAGKHNAVLAIISKRLLDLNTNDSCEASTFCWFQEHEEQLSPYSCTFDGLAVIRGQWAVLPITAGPCGLPTGLGRLEGSRRGQMVGARPLCLHPASVSRN